MAEAAPPALEAEAERMALAAGKATARRWR